MRYKNTSITLPENMLKEAEGVARQEGRTKSELFREALRRYIETQKWQRQWEKLRTYGKAKAKEMGIKPRDISRLIQEYRSEHRQKK